MSRSKKSKKICCKLCKNECDIKDNDTYFHKNILYNISCGYCKKCYSERICHLCGYESELGARSYYFCERCNKHLTDKCGCMKKKDLEMREFLCKDCILPEDLENQSEETNSIEDSNNTNISKRNTGTDEIDHEYIRYMTNIITLVYQPNEEDIVEYKKYRLIKVDSDRVKIIGTTNEKIGLTDLQELINIVTQKLCLTNISNNIIPGIHNKETSTSTTTTVKNSINIDMYNINLDVESISRGS